MRDLRPLMIDLGTWRETKQHGRHLRCTVEDCDSHVAEGKPWCSQHVLTHSPYVVELLGELDRQDRELDLVRHGGTPWVEGEIAQEILSWLRLPMTVRGLTRYMKPLSLCSVTRYVEALEDAGKVRVVGRSRRAKADLLEAVA